MQNLTLSNLELAEITNDELQEIEGGWFDIVSGLCSVFGAGYCVGQWLKNR